MWKKQLEVTKEVWNETRNELRFQKELIYKTIWRVSYLGIQRLLRNMRGITLAIYDISKIKKGGGMKIGYVKDG